MDDARRASSVRRILFQLPTGGGKSHLIQVAAGPRTLALAHADHLIRQLHALTGGQMLAGGEHWDGVSSTVVGMVQTVARRERLPEVDTVICDEAHHATSATYRGILARFPHARVFGYTATPQRLDGTGLDDLFDELIVGPSYHELIDANHLKPFELIGPPAGVDFNSLPKLGGEFRRDAVKDAIRRSKIFGSVVDHYFEHAQALGGHASFWPSIDVAEHHAETMRARGVRCWALHSRCGRVTELLDGLRAGTVDSLASVAMIGEGLDVRGIASVSLGAPTMSLTKYLQECGRCNRGGSGRAVVIDHVGNWTRHGLPDDDREWSLAGRVKRRAAPGALSVWQCLECYGVSRGLSCDICGAPKPRVIVEAEERVILLERIERAPIESIHDVCQSPAEYLMFARQHGKSPSWAAMKLWERDNRASDDNPFLVMAGQLKPTLMQFADAAERVGMPRGQALAAGRAMRLTQGVARSPL